jgi:hypothetical protein
MFFLHRLFYAGLSMYKRIKLAQGDYVLVDDEDFEFLSQWAWRKSHHGYAVRVQHLGYFDGVRRGKTVFMHRLINKTPDGLFTDHINGNKLDNRRENLRMATRTQNQGNRGKNKKGSSVYRGVSFNKKSVKWQVHIKDGVRQRNLGHFDDEIEAAKAYDAAAVLYFGEFAKLNFPQSGAMSCVI